MVFAMLPGFLLAMYERHGQPLEVVIIKGLYSVKTGKTYDGTVLLADTGGKYVNYRIERKS